MEDTLSPDEADTKSTAQWVLERAQMALVGGRVELVSVISEASGATNIRLRPILPEATNRSAEVNLKSDATMVRARQCVLQELVREIPLSICAIRRNALDGNDEIEVNIPHPKDAWKRAWHLCRRYSFPSALHITAFIVATMSVALVCIGGEVI